jgi:excisionase family DNA binding protein
MKATLTVPEAAELLGIGRALAYEGVRDGSIPSVRIGRRVLVPRAKLLALLGEEANTQPAEESEQME